MAAACFAVNANNSLESLVRTNVTPPMIKALLPRAPLGAATILSETTRELTCDAYTKAEADARFQAVGDTAALDARYFPLNSFTEGGPIYNLIQDQFTPRRIRSLVPRAPVTLLPILGNGSALEIEVDCWSKSESDSRYAPRSTLEHTKATIAQRRISGQTCPSITDSPHDWNCYSRAGRWSSTPSPARLSCQQARHE